MNEMSELMMKVALTKFIPGRLNEDLQKMIKPLPGSCFDILEKNPELRNACDAVIVNNLEHFFNPKTHFEQFMPLIRDLLVPGGRAFLSSNTFNFDGTGTDPIYLLYKKRESMGDRYPGFCERDVQFLQQAEGQGIIMETRKVSNVQRPKDDAEVKTVTLGDPSETTHKGHPTLKVHQHIVSNTFSPRIYKDIVAQFPELEVVDSFYITKDGSKTEKKWSEHTNFAAAIIRKKSDTPLAK